MIVSGMKGTCRVVTFFEHKHVKLDATTTKRRNVDPAKRNDNRIRTHLRRRQLGQRVVRVTQRFALKRVRHEEGLSGGWVGERSKRFDEAILLPVLRRQALLIALELDARVGLQLEIFVEQT